MTGEGMTVPQLTHEARSAAAQYGVRMCYFRIRPGGERDLSLMVYIEPRKGQKGAAAWAQLPTYLQSTRCLNVAL